MHRLNRFYWLALIGLVACQNSAPPNSTSTPTATLIGPTDTDAAIALATVRPTETATAIATPLVPTAEATVTQTPTATSTPVPIIRLGLPDWLTPRAAEIQLMLAQYGSEFAWDVLYLGEPASAWQLGELDMMLSPVVGDVPAGLRPLAITAPFVLPIEGLSQTGMEQILAGADPRLTLQPWAEMAVTSKALRIEGLLPDDPGYLVNESYFLNSRPEFARVMGPIATQIGSFFQEPPLLHLTFTGDIMLDRALGYAINVQNDLAYPFAFVADQLRAADITIGNVESAIGDIGQSAPKSYTFQAPPQAAEALALAGFDIVSLANNHGMDFGAESLLQGIELIQAQGVVPIGAGVDATAARAPYLIEQNGQKLAFLAYVNVPIEVSGFDTRVWEATESMVGLAWATPEIVTADVGAIRNQVDHVIIVLHSGFEYQFEPSPPQQAVSHAAIDAGATLVVGHHAHVLQGIEYYGDGVIIYGLGNFAFEIDGDPRTAILNLWLDSSGVRQIEFVPAVIQFGGQPRPAVGDEAAGIRSLVYLLTRRLNPDIFDTP